MLHNFNAPSGEVPWAGPVFGVDGALYGTTLDGGYYGGVCRVSGSGVVYRVAS